MANTTTTSSSSGDIFTGNFFVNNLARFLFQILFIVSLSRILIKILRKLRQPAVIAEMIGGILLGPSAFGKISGFTSTIFPATSVTIINVCSNFGLVVFMFLVGLEMDSTQFAHNYRKIMVIAGTGTVLPVLIAAPVTIPFLGDEFNKTNTFNLMLFMGVALGMSALPVLARILAERNMIASKLGDLVMGATAVDDVMAWCLLSIVVAIVRSSNPLNILYTFLLAIGGFLAIFGPVKKAIQFICRRVETKGDVDAGCFFGIFWVILAVSYAFEAIGLSALVGAFFVGLIIPRNPILTVSLSQKLEDFIVVIIMPLFFTNSGLRTDFGLLTEARDWGLVLFLVVFATIAKGVSIFIPAKLYGLTYRESIAFGVLMSCKGLVALVVVNFGLDYGVITPKLFAILVLMVLFTSVLTVPLTDLVLPLSMFRAQNQAAAALKAVMAENANHKADSREVEMAAASAPLTITVTGTGGDEDTTKGTKVKSSPALQGISFRDKNQQLISADPLSLSTDTDSAALQNAPHPARRLLVVVSNARQAPSLVTIANSSSRSTFDTLTPRGHHGGAAANRSVTASVTAYRPILSMDFPSSYMRNSLQGLLLRDDTLAAAMERAQLHRLQMNVLALPAIGDVVEGLGTIASGAESSFVFLGSTFLADIGVLNNVLDGNLQLSSAVSGVHAFLARSPCDVAVLFDGTAVQQVAHSAAAGSTAVAMSRLVSDVGVAGLMQVTQVLVPVLPGRHCAAALRLAEMLLQNGVEVTALILPSSQPHRQLISPRFKLRFAAGTQESVSPSRTPSIDRSGSGSPLKDGTGSSSSLHLTATAPAKDATIAGSVDLPAIHVDVKSGSTSSKESKEAEASSWEAVITELERGSDAKWAYQLVLLSDYFQTDHFTYNAELAPSDEEGRAWTALARLASLSHIVCVHAAHDDNDPHTHGEFGVSPSTDDLASAAVSSATPASTKKCRSFAMTALVPPPPSVTRAKIVTIHHD